MTGNSQTDGIRHVTKEQLRQYRSTKLEICQLERRIAELERRAAEYDVVQPLLVLYRKKLVELIDGQLKIESAIETLNPTERELIRLRYIDGADWTEVSATIHYEWTQTHRIHARALNKIQSL